MVYEAIELGNVKGLGDVYQVGAPLDKQIQAFEKVGIKAPYLPSLEQVARIRLSGLSNDSSRTSIAPIVIKGEPIILSKDSPLMNTLMARYAVSQHKIEKYPSFQGTDIYEQAREIAIEDSSLLPEKRRAIILPHNEDFILTPQTEEVIFLLGEATQEYFNRFTKNTNGRIKFYNLKQSEKNQTLVNYLWFYNQRDDSGVNAGDRNLFSGYRSFGVLDSVPKAHAPKKTLRYPYTDRQLNSNSKIVQGVMEGNLPASKLEKVAGFLEKLRKD